MGYEPSSLISLSFWNILYFGVWCTKVFDTFRNSLILLNIMNVILLHDLPYQGNPFYQAIH